jgi:hypothetical protein
VEVHSSYTEIHTILYHYSSTGNKVGRPRTRWADVVQRVALQLLGIRGWRRRTANIGKWGRLMREAKARKGL